MSDALHSALERVVRRQAPGVAAVVVAGDTVSGEGAAGVRDIESRAPLTPDTALIWFSMTKIVTATAVMQLAESGALELDAPVAELIPGFPEPRRGWPAVRVRHLLSHSSGLANPMPVRWVHPAGEAGRDSAAFLDELLEGNKRLRSPAGSRARYSNLGYIALGEVVRAASGRPYQDYVRSSILEPLGMRRTGFDYAGLGEDVATGHQARLSPMTPLFRLLLPRGIVGSARGRFLRFNRFLVDGAAYGGLIGSSRDAARFMAAHLNGGRLGDVELLSPAGVAEMQRMQASGRRLQVGFGWMRRGGPEAPLEHLGGGGGFWTMMRIDPERRLGVLAMGNSTRWDHGSVARAAIG